MPTHEKYSYQEYRRYLIANDSAYKSFRDSDLKPGYMDWLHLQGVDPKTLPEEALNASNPSFRGYGYGWLICVFVITGGAGAGLVLGALSTVFCVLGPILIPIGISLVVMLIAICLQLGEKPFTKK